MNGVNERIERPEGFGETVTTARDLIARLADDLELYSRDEVASTTLRDAVDVLGRLLPPVTDEQDISDEEVDTIPYIFLDVSDLLAYFEHNRLPTGIQRVQAELIAAILKSDSGHVARLCCFIEEKEHWSEVNSVQFVDVCERSRVDGDPLEPSWRTAVRDLRSRIVAGNAVSFPHNAMLVNVGSSWWISNYFTCVRQAKAVSDVRYVPLIYDLIPMLTPENCAPELVEEFIAWLIGVLDHADFYLAISQATRRDIIALAQKLGRPILPDRVEVVALDANFCSAEPHPLVSTRRFAEPFVLFVSTLEARKNQLGALDAWAELIARHGAAQVPRLVLVGKRGFQSDLILSRISINADLRERVTILSSIEDIELRALYRDCLFTIYPSHYEGWGLPVTESLCYGKVPLIADNSSLPEAGGVFALYFKTGSTVAMTALLERLILDDRFRKKQEQMIRDGFKPHSWEQIGGNVIHYLRQWIAVVLPRWQPAIVEAGTYYPMLQQHTTQVWPGMGSAEQFRSGFGWFKMESGGCWAKHAGGGLAMRIPAEGARRIGFELICPDGLIARYRIGIAASPQIVVGQISADKPKWVFLDLPTDTDDEPLRVHISTMMVSQPAPVANGDPRDLGIGLRGFFVLSNQATSRIDFLEAVALGGLADLNFYRDRSLDAKVE